MSGRLFAVAVPVFWMAAPVQAADPERPSPMAVYVTEAAQRAGIPEDWIWSVIRVESGGDIHAVSRAGAMGLMQLMPATWSDMRVRLSLGGDPFDPHDNLIAGAVYLKAMHDRYGEPGFLAAYNAGPQRYDDYLAGRRPLPVETLSYVTRLTPKLGMGALTDPRAWTRATLFVGPSEQGWADRNRPAGVADASPIPAKSLPSDGLFVRVAHVDRP